jgi:hypothetical protein
MGMTIEGKGNASLKNNSLPHTVYVLQNAVPPVRATTYCILYSIQGTYFFVKGFMNQFGEPNTDFWQKVCQTFKQKNNQKLKRV